jgi:hypothetical protein
MDGTNRILEKLPAQFNRPFQDRPATAIGILAGRIGVLPEIR